MRTLVLGIGNLLLSDEGIGVRAIQTLEAHYQIPPEVELFDGGTSGMELMEAMADRDLLIVVDAVRSNHEAG
ncbi:MAG TPA: hydrogenase 2 maturation endopeptidase, partial [Enterobacteriaceae bacterium]|nr:hydrogenase 2 maturation endopeptidase [Enterobacteriaceae bacterium]